MHRGHTKQGSRLVRWAALEAVARQRGGTYLQEQYRAISERRNSKGVAKVAVARRLLHLVYYACETANPLPRPRPHDTVRAQPDRDASST